MLTPKGTSENWPEPRTLEQAKRDIATKEITSNSNKIQALVPMIGKEEITSLRSE